MSYKKSIFIVFLVFLVGVFRLAYSLTSMFEEINRVGLKNIIGNIWEGQSNDR